MTKHIGILGGTFDPVHLGHVSCARFVQQHCQLDEVRLMPCHLPAHRATPGATSEQRAAMVTLAIQSYTRLSLERLEPNSRFYFIIGMDSLCYFQQWKDWQGILKQAHILVCQRPGYSAAEGDAPFLLQHYGINNVTSLKQVSAGKILLLDNPLHAISASHIRQQLVSANPGTDTLDPVVLNYIATQQLYQA